MALYAFDGTGKSATLDSVEQPTETNVAHFHDAYAGSKTYLQGVGTKLGLPGKAIGDAFGAGDLDRLNEAYKKLCENWQAGDHIIDIIGFSRGAALALDFANNIESKGIRHPDSDGVVEQKPAIRFLGLWDVVGAFGLAVNVGLEFQKINLGHHLYIPDNVEYCFHAMAMDERRQTFRATRVLNGYEVWFRGVHSDVGGGNDNAKLSNISLRWMFHKAIAVGLPISDTVIAAHEIDPDKEIKPPLDFIPDAYRDFLKGDRFHYAVKARPNHNNPPDDYVHETEADELKAIPMADLERREAIGNDGPAPGEHLEVGQKVGKTVHARNCWNTVGIAVKKDERYDISATGQWLDKKQPCSAAGYEKWFLAGFKKTRRVPKSHWFCLIAAVHPSHVLEFEESNTTNTGTEVLLELFEHKVKKRDDESQLVAVGEKGSIEVDRDGYLYLFANDTPGAYANNSGDVQATIERTA
jgi:hypothetical protein